MSKGRVYLNSRKEERVYAGHPWIFRSDIDRAEKQVMPGDVVDVINSKGRFVAKAVYNPQSQISLRILSRIDEPINEAFIRQRVKEAVDLRRSFADLRSCRLIFAESDRLPAIIADSFGGVISMQCLSLGMERFKGLIADALMQECGATGVYERNDVPIRELEGLNQHTGVLRGEVPDRIIITENGIKLSVDVKNGQKTGYFLDQKENRAALAPYAPGKKALDCCTHIGSFALHLAQYGAKEVTGVDISEEAVKNARENAILNGFSQLHFDCANVFDYLRQKEDEGERYGLIVLDPPAFAKNKASLEGAVKGYKEINLRAMKLIEDGGILVSCSCSQNLVPSMFRDVLLKAAQDARVQLQQLEWRGQGRDHPVLLSAPETHYLKCGIFRVLR